MEQYYIIYIVRNLNLVLYNLRNKLFIIIIEHKK